MQAALMNRTIRQVAIGAWCVTAFGEDQARSLAQRGLRLLEEAAEAAQAAGVSPAMAHQLIDYVYSRPVGELRQELGGVGIGILALAEAAGFDADVCELLEAKRVLDKPIEHFRQRNAAKNAAGLLVEGVR